ncbi:MAG: hypothetical protein HOV81_27295 [Kofleriaceae bacterium]|nr:hypothetical protein [Kofleriaceae bacterium]
MRTSLYAALALAGLTGGCKWTDFDDLADQTWVRSTEKPSIGSTDYATAIVGVSTGSSGGQLAVISNDTPNYSLLDYTAEGSADVGANPQKLGQHFIATLSEPPIFITDGNGKIALVERAIDAGNIAVVTGPANAVVDSPFSSAFNPDSAAFAGANLEVAAGATIYTLTGTGAPTACASSDTTFRAAAMASDGTTLFTWSSAGVFGGIPVSALAPCVSGSLPNVGSTYETTGFMPGTGAKIHLVGKYAILAAHAGSSRMGQVFVVDTSNMSLVGSALNVDGLRSSTVGVFDGKTYLALGVPDRAVDGVVSGQVDVYELDTTTGMLGAAPALVLNDAQADSGELFGRTVTTMQFNGQSILVVGANNEVFAYYKTSLYDALP